MHLSGASLHVDQLNGWNEPTGAKQVSTKRVSPSIEKKDQQRHLSDAVMREDILFLSIRTKATELPVQETAATGSRNLMSIMRAESHPEL